MTSSPDFAQRLRVCRWGAILALFTVLVGFALGGVFGAFEDSLKADLSALAETGRDSVYGGDAAKMKSVVEKSWAYYKRAHLHGGGIGAAALSVILLLASLRRPTVVLGTPRSGCSRLAAHLDWEAPTRPRNHCLGWRCHPQGCFCSD
jgi:hypothetical protein